MKRFNFLSIICILAVLTLNAVGSDAFARGSVRYFELQKLSNLRSDLFSHTQDQNSMPVRVLVPTHSTDEISVFQKLLITKSMNYVEIAGFGSQGLEILKLEAQFHMTSLKLQKLLALANYPNLRTLRKEIRRNAKVSEILIRTLSQFDEITKNFKKRYQSENMLFMAVNSMDVQFSAFSAIEDIQIDDLKGLQFYLKNLIAGTVDLISELSDADREQLAKSAKTLNRRNSWFEFQEILKNNMLASYVRSIKEQSQTHVDSEVWVLLPLSVSLTN